MTLKIEIYAHEEGGYPLAQQVDEALAAIGFVRHIRTLEGSTAIPAPQPAVCSENVADGAQQFTDAEIPANTPGYHPVQRERGKPAPGKARRTKEEIAEDEAADAADQAGAVDDNTTEAKQSQIRTNPENRVSPDDVTEDDSQDAVDEKSEVEEERKPEKPLTRDDVKAVMTQYVNTYGLPATQEDGPKLIGLALGKPPEGEDYWKLSLIPEETEALKKVVDAFSTALQQNPYKRDKAA